MTRPLRVVVTRPAGQAEALRDALNQAGFDAVALPVMAIEPLDADVITDAMAGSGDVDLLIFVSTNAVRFALPYLPASDQLGATTIAVGPSTGRALTDAGYRCDVVPDAGFTTEALLEDPALNIVLDKRVMIVRGSGGRALLGDTLRERGAQVVYAEVYRREIPAAAASDLRLALDEGFDAITATSVETLLNIEELAGPERLGLLHDVNVVTASDRVLKKAQVLGYTQDVLLASAPDDSALVGALTHWRSTQPPVTVEETQSMATDENHSDKRDASSPEASDDVIEVEATQEATTLKSEAVIVEPPAPEPAVEVSAPVVPAPAPAKSGGRGLSLLAILLSLGALALSGFNWWTGNRAPEPVAVVETEDPTIALNAVADTLRSDVNSVRDDVQRTATALRDDVERKIKSIDLASVTDEVDDVAGEQTALSRRLSGQERSITTVTDRLTSMESDMSAMQGVSDSVRNTWVRAEAEYFLQTANSRLQLAADVNSALSALRAADERIGALGDPGLIKVRAKLTEEILSVEAVPQPDIEGIAVNLLGMAERVPELPIEKGEITTRYEPTPDGGNIDELSGWERARASVGGVFSDIVRITPDDGNVTAIMAPENAYFIYRNLELNLNIARLALLRQDTENFEGSITTASRWLEQHFDQTDPGVKSMIARLNELSTTPIDPEMPDISGSLRMLRALVAASSTSP